MKRLRIILLFTWIGGGLFACNPLRYDYTTKLEIQPATATAQNAVMLEAGQSEAGVSVALMENTLRLAYGILPNLEADVLGSYCFNRRSWDGFAGLKYGILSWNNFSLAVAAGNHFSYSEWAGGFWADYVRLPLYLSWQLPKEFLVISFSPQFWFEVVAHDVSHNAVLPAVHLLTWHLRFDNRVKETGENFPLRTGLELSYTQPLGADVSQTAVQLYYIGIDINYRFGRTHD